MGDFSKRALTSYVCLVVICFSLLLSGCNDEQTSRSMHLSNNTKSEDSHDYQRFLFNELTVRLSSFPDNGFTFERRLKLFDEFNKDGFILYGLALELFSFGGGHNINSLNKNAFDSLISLAENGNGPANCLAMFAISNWERKSKYVKKYSDKKSQYIRTAVDFTPSYCDLTYAIEHRNGSSGVEKNIDVFFEYTRRAAMRGSVSARKMLTRAYIRGYNGYPIDYPRALCWYKLAKEVDTGEVDNLRFSLGVGYVRKRSIDITFGTKKVKSTDTYCESDGGLSINQAIDKWIKAE